jgi:hypothetical protein
MADVISSLPTDKIPPTKEENDILKWLFPKDTEARVEKLKNDQEDVQYSENTPKEKVENQRSIPQGAEKSRKLYSIAFIFIITLTFFMLNLNFTNGIFQTFFQTSNQYIFALMKTTLFLILFVSTIFVMKKINV